jgi:hypothetical protein
MCSRARRRDNRLIRIRPGDPEHGSGEGTPARQRRETLRTASGPGLVFTACRGIRDCAESPLRFAAATRSSAPGRYRSGGPPVAETGHDQVVIAALLGRWAPNRSVSGGSPYPVRTWALGSSSQFASGPLSAASAAIGPLCRGGVVRVEGQTGSLRRAVNSSEELLGAGGIEQRAGREPTLASRCDLKARTAGRPSCLVDGAPQVSDRLAAPVCADRAAATGITERASSLVVDTGARA